MTSPAFQRLFLHLALLATTLLAVLPTAGRLLGGNGAGNWVALCTATGLSLVDLDALDGAGPGSGKAPPHAADDCAYCPLGASQLPIAALRWPGLIDAPGRRPLAAQHTGPGHVYPLGLGSRGPPTHS